jgi:hypothetical protein
VPQPADAGADGGLGTTSASCSDLELVGREVEPLGVVGAPGTSASASLPTDGTYDLVEARVYRSLGGVAGPTGATLKGAVSVSGSSIELVLRAQPGGADDRRRGILLLADAGTGPATIAWECPRSENEQVSIAIKTTSAEGFTLGRLTLSQELVFARRQ